jgi:AAA domain
MLQHWYLDIDERKAAPVTLEAFSDLVEWYFLDEDHPGMSPPLCLGWDIHRTFGAEGFPIWRDLMFGWEPPLLAAELMAGDMRTAVTTEEYEAALVADWADFDRPMQAYDQLIIDAMSRARDSGWEVGGDEEVISKTEAILDDLAKRSGAKRAAVEAVEDERSRAEDERRFARAEKCYALDDAAYAEWIAAGEPNGKARKFSRWHERRFFERREQAFDEDRAECAKMDRVLDDENSTEAEQDAAVATYKKRQAAWWQYYGDLWPEGLPGFIAPGTPMPPSSHLKSVPAEPLPPVVKTSAEFIGGFVPPEYLIDGIVQRRYFYSMTAQTGVGKTSIAMRWMAHVVTGQPIGDKEVQQGAVLYFAGENPDDVRARWLVLTRDMGIDPATKDVHWIVGAKDLFQAANQINAEVAAKGLSLAYVVVDTAAAYNTGDDENSNTQAGNFARHLRSLTNLPGGPCVVVLCHPTKRAADDDLLPRGGGAFLAEVDGNMAVQKKDSLLAVSPQGKYRGDTSWVLRYELEVIRDHPVLKDVRGRPIASVVARPVGEGTAAVLEKRADLDMETVLAAVDRTRSATPTDLARSLGWTFGPKAEPNVNRVKRNLSRLLKDKLVKETIGKWRTTPAGEKELNAIDVARAAAPKPMFPLPPTFGLPR